MSSDECVTYVSDSPGQRLQATGYRAASLATTSWKS